MYAHFQCYIAAMTTPPADGFDALDLRRQVERRLQSQARRGEQAHEVPDTQRQLHELQLRQIELELQNEELRQARARLEAAAERYADLYDFAPVGYITLNRSGNINQCNLALASLLGTERSGLIGECLGFFVAQADKGIFSSCLEQVFASRTPQTCELQLNAKDGQFRCVYMQAAASRDGLELRAVLLDMSEEKRAKEALQISEERLAFALRASGDGVWDWNIANQRVVFSRQLPEMLGYSPDEFGNTLESWSTRVLPQDLPLARAAMAQHFAGHSVSYECEYRMVCKDGNIRWILARGQVQQRNAADEPLRMVGTHTDITQRKLRSERRLAQDLAVRDALVREVHHRIKNNLQGVAGLLSEFGRTHPQTQDAIAQLVGQVQSVAVIHGLQGQVMPAQVRLCELTTAVAQGVTSLWQVPVVVTIPQPWMRRALAPEDAVPVALVLNELMVNAVKHSRPAKSPVQVALQMVDTSCAVQVSIVNSGDWVPAAAAPAVATPAVAAGTGLPLMRALLPRDGAQLTHHAKDGCVCTVLVLRPPVLGFCE